MNISTQAANLFKHIAENTHHRLTINELLSHESNEVRELFLLQDAVLLKKQLSNNSYLCDTCAVTAA